MRANGAHPKNHYTSPRRIIRQSWLAIASVSHDTSKKWACNAKFGLMETVLARCDVSLQSLLFSFLFSIFSSFLSFLLLSTCIFSKLFVSSQNYPKRTLSGTQQQLTVRNSYTTPRCSVVLASFVRCMLLTGVLPYLPTMYPLVNVRLTQELKLP